jgi:thymidylate kinase
MGKDFFENIAHGYKKCEKLEILKNRFIMIDANRYMDAIFQDIISYLR